MKTKVLFSILLVLVTVQAYSQFQKSVAVSNKHFHDLNITPVTNGSTGYFASGNLFDATMQTEELFLKRLDSNGNIVWFKKYTNTAIAHARSFDIVNFGDLIVMTGSIDVAGTKRVFIAKFLASNGNFINAEYYTIVSPSFNSRGLKIIFTESDADGDGSPDVGFVVGGFFSDCYNVNTNCINNNIGFVLRTDFNLNLIWTIEVDSNNSTNNLEYDFVNGIVETANGFFITGSATSDIPGVVPQQAILARKLDFFGNFVWDMSYIFGNSQDLSVDAYYDNASDEIYMLVNYSITHYFGVTTYNATTGTLIPAKSWHATDPGGNLNRYGFKIMESTSNSNNLVIAGYDRDENYVDMNGNAQFGQSNIFVYEFAKANGAQVASFQYLVPHIEPLGDEFNFWTAQMPLIYYPDISFPFTETGGSVFYYYIGYRTTGSPGFTEAELFKTTNTNLRNQCENMPLIITPNPFSMQPTPVISGPVPNLNNSFTLNETIVPFSITSCDPTLSLDETIEDKSEMYPNPSGNYVYFTSENVNKYKLFDAFGRLINEGVFTDEKAIFVGNLEQGVYFITLYSQSNSKQIFKLIKK